MQLMWMLYVYMYSVNTQLYNTTYGNDVHDLSDNTHVQIKIYPRVLKRFYCISEWKSYI